MADIMKVLTDLGVDFSKTDHQHYKLESAGYMDLIVETWRVSEWLHVSVAHYYVQEGDLMADPEIEFRTRRFQDIDGKWKWKIEPIHFKQDNLGIYHQAMFFEENGQILCDLKLQKNIRSFLLSWSNNIKNQGFKLDLSSNGKYD
jgi:hypothetical protein